jgi:hypothetical protein
VNRRLISKVAVAAVIVAFIVVIVPAVLPTDQSSVASESEFTVDDKSIEFLSSVVGLDFSKYALVVPTPSPGINSESWAEIGAKSEAQRREALYPPEYCGLVKDEWGSFKLDANGSQISVNSNCLNGQLRLLKISNLAGEYVYVETPATGILDQAKTILQRYQDYVTQVDAMDGSYLVPMQEILNNLSDFTPTNVTVGNVNFQVTLNDAGRTRIQWIYTENNISMSYKQMELVFCNNCFESFWDGWRIYKVSELNSIIFKEAYTLAFDAAQSCELRWVNDEVNQVLTTPDLSNAFYEVLFDMVPYRNDTSHTSKMLSRDPLTLYPYWSFTFYFPDGRIGCFSGVNVGLWGDTKEIISCDGQLSHNYPWG